MKKTVNMQRGRFFTKVSVSLASCVFLLGGCSKHHSTSDQSTATSSDNGAAIPGGVEWCEQFGKDLKTMDTDEKAALAALKVTTFAICTAIKGANFLSNPGRSISNLGEAIRDSIKNGRQEKLKNAIGTEITAKVKEITPYFHKVLTEANIPETRITAAQVTQVALAAIAYDSKDLNPKSGSQTILKDSKGEKISLEQMQKAWGKASNPVHAFDLVGDASFILGADFSDKSRAEVLTYVVKSAFALDTSNDPLALKNSQSAYAMSQKLFGASTIYLQEGRYQ